MKKILLFIFCFLLIGCSKNELPNLSSEYILSVINKKITFENSVEEDLKQQSVAERYGISPNDIESGVVYYTKDEDKSDKIIIAKASSKDTVENIERALSTEIISVSDSWKHNEMEMSKIEKHILKTKDLYVIMAISNKAKEIENLFDSCFE
ncbi:DUF4358 domain-containing protein [[Clostridium] colinum]|uniref:DUF4358 domain-containing protein n=1 Tax=[Clostridium] colinum TaxID=36835 RepID=UPI0020254CB9|nr:DUF4358 domain-containing protein [[Clostridium] colinum]